MKKAILKCILCNASATDSLATIGGLDYHRCNRCKATFLNPGHRLSRREEYAQYLEHQNKMEDRGYQRFLSKLADPLLKKIPPDQSGLDYGCGPGPVLATMLSDAGQHMNLFDPFFYPDRSVLDRTYDFITCTETIEHMHRPALEFRLLNQLLKPGGWLGIMTCFQTDDSLFSSWHYRRDPTHVIFYRETTLLFIAAKFGFSCEIPVKDVTLMQKPY